MAAQSTEKVYTFGGRAILNKPLVYSGNTFTINENDDCWSNSFGSVYGTTNGSYYFNYLQLGKFFSSLGSSFTGGTSIDNANQISYGGYNWRIPTRDDIFNMGSTYSRPGSIVNGNSGILYACVGLSSEMPNGIKKHGTLLFPDNETITGSPLIFNSIQSGQQTTGVTQLVIDNYISQGCVFILDGGNYYSNVIGWYYQDNQTSFSRATASIDSQGRPSGWVGLSAFAMYENETPYSMCILCRSV